jgi:hypothetical protein|uniref:Uncharacterized protein n=1 Tax=viral metagenome TaxID=1070528 RepID=A0A6C0IN99_9ZZZZ
MRLGWITSILIIALGISLIYNANIQEPMTSTEMEQAMAYDVKNEFKKGEIQSSPEIAEFEVVIQVNQNNNSNATQDNNEFSKKNNDIVYNMGCVLEKETEANVREPSTIKKGEVTNVKLPMETNKLNSYIALSPKDGKYFPSSFQLKITNKVDVNKYNYELWGTTPGIEGAPSNGVLTSNNITSMPYPTDLYEVKGTNLVIGNIDIGNKALNIISIGNIFDENFNIVGNVDSLNNDIIINCDKAENITGLLIYIGAPVPIQ